MELGHYGWNRKVDIFQQHTVFLEQPAPATPNYGVLNIGDAPFDGVSTGHYSGPNNSTNIAVNLKTAGGTDVFVHQVNGVTLSQIAGDGTVFLLAGYKTLSAQGILNLGNQFYTGAGQFAGSANGTYLAINAQSGFTGNFIDCQKAGSSVFYLGPYGNVQMLGALTVAHGAEITTLYGSLNVGDGGFGGFAGQFAGSSSGTGIAVSIPSGFTGNIADWQVNGVRKFSVSATGDVTAATVTTTKLRGTEALDIANRFL